MSVLKNPSCPHQDPTFKLFGTPGEDYFKGNPKSLNFYFLVIWWGKLMNEHGPRVKDLKFIAW